MSDILVLGALHYDVVVDAPRLPEVDETLPGTAVDYRFGGKGGNQAVAAARMGARVAMAGRVGRDGAAETILAALEVAGVDASQVREVDQPTGMSVAITLPSGEYGAVIVSGANLSNDGKADLSAPPKTVILQNEIPEAANVALARALPPEMRLIVNAAPARPLNDEIAARTDMLIVNHGEAEALTGLADPLKAAKALEPMVRGMAVVTLGAGGLIAVDKSETRLLPARKVNVVSAHGAGDMFVGALAASVTAGEWPLDALQFAVDAAGLFVSLPIRSRQRIDVDAVRAFSGR